MQIWREQARWPTKFRFCKHALISKQSRGVRLARIPGQGGAEHDHPEGQERVDEVRDGLPCAGGVAEGADDKQDREAGAGPAERLRHGRDVYLVEE
jgi:hypothetical protein